MLKRMLEKEIVESLNNFPIVGILGARQVGKTTLAKIIKNRIKKKVIYLDLELSSDIDKLHNPEIYLKYFENELIIIDEIQRLPELFPLLRALVDQKRIPGRFLILGSASPALIKKSSESLAGRIIYHELTPFNLIEIEFKKKEYQDLWLRGGYPESYLASDIEFSVTWRGQYINTFIERDIAQLGGRISSIQMKRFFTMIAHIHGQLLNVNQLSNSLDLSNPTINSYLDIFEETFLIKRIHPYYANIKKRLIKSPKLYIRDSGIFHSLLRINTFEELQGTPQVGNSWEGFVIEQLYSILPRNWKKYFFRTNAGAEIDLFILPSLNKRIAIEIKYSLSPKLSKGFWLAFSDLNCTKGYIIYPGTEYYPVNENIFMLPFIEIEKIIKDN